jgi:hypothetical protein
LSVKLSKRPLTSWRLAAGAFASESRSRMARGAGRSPMLRYSIRSVMGLRNLRRAGDRDGWAGKERTISGRLAP